MADERPTPPRAPAGLGKAGKALWREIWSVFDLRDEPHLQATLEQACKIRDRLAQLEAGLEGEPLTVLGSAKQLTAHPLIPEIRFQQKTLVDLLSKLGLPDNSDGESMSDRNRRAARARWDNPRA